MRKLKNWQKDFFASAGCDVVLQRYICNICEKTLRNPQKQDKLFSEHSKFGKTKRAKKVAYNPDYFDDLPDERIIYLTGITKDDFEDM
jgi:hypothetical protein